MASLLDIPGLLSGFFSQFTQPAVYINGQKVDSTKAQVTTPVNATKPLLAPATPAPTPTSQPTQAPLFVPQQSVDEQRIRQNISNTWGADTPLLNDLGTFLEAGKQMPQGVSPYLPIVLALRETQGGKDNKKPNTITGQNNYFNFRDVTREGKFVDYPNVQTAVMGGWNPFYNQNSGGLVGQLNGPVYTDFRNSGNVKDLFAHWSPPNDNNGSLDEQFQNYQYILNKLNQ